MGKLAANGPFSIAMLVITRGYVPSVDSPRLDSYGFAANGEAVVKSSVKSLDRNAAEAAFPASWGWKMTAVFDVISGGFGHLVDVFEGQLMIYTYSR